MPAITKFAEALKYLRTYLDKKTVPMYWIEFLLVVAAAGDQGTTTVEAAKEVNMQQAIASRTVGILSESWNKETRRMEGYQLIMPLQNDPHYKQRQRLYLTKKGKALVADLEKILT